MRDGSLCPVDSKSTRGIKTAASQEGGDSGSLPENLKDVLRRQEGKRSRMPSNQEEEKKKKMADDKSGCGVGKGTVNSKREILMSVSEAVKHWEAADGNKSSKNFNEAQSSLSSPGKFGFRETLACSLNIAEDKEDTPLFIEDEKEDLHVNCSDQYRASLLEHDVEIETKSQEKSLKDEKEQPPPPSPTEPAEELSDVLKRYQHPRKPRCYSHSSSLPSELTKEQALAAKQQAQAKSNLFLRLTRQVRYGRRGSLQNLGRGRPNKIKLHIYDLIPAETVMQLPWGCYFPIGRCFDAVNNGLHSMGTGAYHAGVEVNGIEYAYGACDIAGHTGLFSCVPKRSPGYQYRTTIDFGERSLVKMAWVNVANNQEEKNSDQKAPTYKEMERYVDGREVIKQMATEYMGIDYDLLRKNCVTFARDVCIRLGVKEEEIPTWFRNLCESGALTQDVALQTVEPIQNIFSACEDYGDFEDYVEDGFEVISTLDGKGVKEVVRTADSVETGNYFQCADFPSLAVRKTLSWTY